MSKLNTDRDETPSSITTLRRIASLVAGLAILMGVVMAASPARAEEKLILTISATGLDVTFSATGCNADATHVVYSLEDASGTRLVNEAPVPGWNKGDTTLKFTWTFAEAGSYQVMVSCFNYAGTGRSADKTFTVAEPQAAPSMAVNRTTWPVTSKVTLTAKGLKPGEDAKFYLAYPGELDAYEVWETKANASGVATATVTLPTESQYPSSQGEKLKPGDYELGATADSLESNVKVTVWLRADGTWSTSGGNGGGGPSGELPKTGD